MASWKVIYASFVAASSGEQIKLLTSIPNRRPWISGIIMGLLVCQDGAACKELRLAMELQAVFTHCSEVGVCPSHLYRTSRFAMDLNLAQQVRKR